MSKRSEKKYTIEEAKTEIERQRCERGGHQPPMLNIFAKHDVNAGILCSCGQYRWTAARA